MTSGLLPGYFVRRSRTTPSRSWHSKTREPRRRMAAQAVCHISPACRLDKMARYEGLIDPAVIDYVLRTSVREADVAARLRKETAGHPKSNFQIPPEQGQLLQLLIRMTGARRVIEVGVFTGYSSLAMALALPPDGRITACDISEEYTSTARRYWAEAGVTGKIDLRIAPAKDTLDGLIAALEG